MSTLAKAAIPGSVLWPLLLGAAVTLVGTVLAQWLSLTYQTSRQRQARRADRQETRLLALQDLLGEVDDSVRQGMIARAKLYFAFEREGRDLDALPSALITSEPQMEVLRSLTYRLRLLAAGVEHKELRVAVGDISHWAWHVPVARSNQEFNDARDKLTQAQLKAVDELPWD